jgi:hypothetical protein
MVPLASRFSLILFTKKRDYKYSLSPPTYWRADHRRAGGSVDSNRLVFVRQGAVRHRPRPLDHEYRWTLERRRETRDAAARRALSPARAIALGHEGSRPS